MNEKDTYYGRGNASMFDDYMDFINYVFGFNGTSSDFKTLLPKLYKPEYDPSASSYFAVEDGKIKAAIGAFDHDITVCGQTLRTRGIGNVAVHPYARSRGYMKTLMNMSVDDMVKEGIVLSVLGGNRHRYNYFSFDKSGTLYSLSFNSNNFRHTFGSERTHTLKFKCISASDTGVIDAIISLYNSKPFHAVRSTDAKKNYEIMTSWKQSVWAGFDNGEFAGYCILRDDSVTEMIAVDENNIREFVCAFYDSCGKSRITVKFPPFQSNYIEQLIRLCEYFETEPDKSFSVLDYKAVIGAFLKLKLTYTTLPDGELTLYINGRAKPENLTITVRDGNSSVEYTDLEPLVRLEHLDAINLLFSPLCPARDRLPDFARIWLPLPLYIHSSDTV